MRMLVYNAVLLVILASLRNSAKAKEWRGLIPLRSTRADVIRLLNQCSDQREACRFSLEGDNIYILFAAGLPADYSECAKRLSSDTIVFIQVEPRRPLKFKEFHLRNREYESFNPSDPFRRGFQGFRTPDGFVIRADKGQIDRLIYIASESDKSLCPKYYENPESFVAVIFNHYDTMTIDGPETIKAGERLTLVAYANINDKSGYTWTVNSGRILSGQYTTQIVIDTEGLAGQKIVVSAEIGDGFGHYMSSSHTVQIRPN